MRATVLAFNSENIPAELKQIPRWVCWREESIRKEDGPARKTKVPYNARTGKKASSTDSETWSSYNDAVSAVGRDHHDGVGFVLNGDGVVGCDLDHCVDPEKRIAPWAMEIIGAIPTYWEISPSGEGLRGLCRGKLPAAGRKKGSIEVYERQRYVTITGNHLDGTPLTIEDCSAQLLTLHAKVWPSKNGTSGNGAHRTKPMAPVDLDDSELLARAFEAKNGDKFRRLWNGDRSDYADDKSASDLALCSMIAFWTGRDATRIEALFNRSSLIHDSWTNDHRYRHNTIHKAIELTTETYSPHRNGSSWSTGATSTSEEKEGQSQAELLILDPANPLPSARAFVERYHVVDDVRAIQHQAGVFYRYQREFNSYVDVDEAAIRASLYTFLEKAQRWSEPKGEGQKPQLVPFKPIKAKIENVLDALRAVSNLPAFPASPCWLESSDLNPLDILACRNGLLYLPTRRLLRPSPRFFTLNGIDFEFNAKAPTPEHWLRFLDQLWTADAESIAALQEWMGYLLTPRTHFQKMLMLVGPKRSGKGTIGRVSRMLLGDRNVCGPTLANMSEQFGLSILIGKSAAIIADARIGGRADTAVITERLLSISGEDTLSIPRKFLPDWNGKLPTRFLLMTNELPRIEDASGALASRFLILALSESFYGREDHGLLDRFIPELPGILLWAIDGWERLNRRGRFVQPESAAELIQQFEDLGSPIGAFIRERCDVGKAHSVVVDRLFQSWKAWCDDNGRERPGTSQAFGRNLRAAVPWLSISQPRVAGDRIRYYEGIRLKDEY